MSLSVEIFILFISTPDLISNFCEFEILYIVFGQTILVIPFYLLEWSKWFENDLEWFEKK